MNLPFISFFVAFAIAFPAAAHAQATKTKAQKLPGAKAQLNGNAATKQAATKQKAVDPPADQNRATRFLTNDDFAVIVLQPKSFFTDPANELLPIEIITAMGLKEGGIDPVKIERITFTLSGIDRFPAPPELAGVMEMSEPVDPTKVFSRQAQWGEPQKLSSGAIVRRAQRPNEPSIAFVDDRTIVFALDEKLDRLLAAAAVDSRVARRLASYDGKSHAFAVVDLDAVREPLAMLKPMATQAPPQLQEFFNIPELLTAIELKLTIAGTTNAQFVLYGRDEAAAAETERLLNHALQMGREIALASVSQNFREQDREIQQAFAQWIRRLADKVVKSITPTRVRNRVTITASVDSGYAGVAVLPALLLPAVNAAREAARRNASINNMKQITLGMHNYLSAHKKFPDRANLDKNGNPLLSWRVHILPYIEEEQLYKQFNLDEPWDSEHNKALLDKIPAVYRNPNFPSQDKTNYLLPVGKGTAWAENEGPRMKDITDGTSHTIILLEVDPVKAVVWTKPEDLEIDTDNPLDGLGNVRQNRVFGAGMFDAGVKMIQRDQFDPTMFLLLLDPRDGTPTVDDVFGKE